MRFLFFFFKQKTAYEVRISDWSSDVCSSDLAEISESSARSSWLRRRRARQARSCSPTGRAWVSMVLSLAAPEPQSHYVQVIDPTTQIGRASCRERVCQYV